MRLFSNDKLKELQSNLKCVRNICILAHVDHGKTTLADSLVASNGIISQRLVGKLRYMDSRKDEQERGITMKSSSISLLSSLNGKEYLINLIDSPGHVDFSSEVSTAVRLCDGAIIVVDVVEGVCAQTKVVLKQAWLEHIRPVLVLNKIDRLITEMKLKPLDAYVRMMQLLEQVNAIVGELFTIDVMSKAEALADASSGLDEADDSDLYFAPEQGNVVFASAADGWGFSVVDFARMFASKLGVDQKALESSLWGDFYYNSKEKSVLPGAQAKAKKPLFVQIVLENLWAVYEAVVIRKDKLMVEKIVHSLNLKVLARDLKHSDPKVQIQAILTQWLPLSDAVLRMVCEKLPGPLHMTSARAEKLMSSRTKTFDSLPPATQQLKDDFIACSPAEDAPVIVFVSKMIPVDRQSLPQFKPRPLTAEDIAQRRLQVRQRHAELMQQQQTLEKGQPLEVTESKPVEEEKETSTQPEEENGQVFVAFARVFSGNLRRGQKLYVLGPKYDPSSHRDDPVDPNLALKDLKSGQHVTVATVGDLYLLMGRELELLDSVPAGNVVGIGGLEEHVLKSATLSSTLDCPAFTELTEMAVPIVRVAVEPSKPSEMPALIRGLKLLNQADPCVKVILQETGEHVLITAGEVHLQRCLQDLRERYAHVEVNASQPIVPFRETIVEGSGADANPTEFQTPNKRFSAKIRAVPLPEEVTRLLENSVDVIRLIGRRLNVQDAESALAELKLTDDQILSGQTKVRIQNFRQELERVLSQSGTPWNEPGIAERIVSFGPKRCGPNLLLNRSTLELGNAWNVFQGTGTCQETMEWSNSIINGFQLATLAGPLCEEPLMGVAYILEECSVLSADESVSTHHYGPFTGQIISSVKEGCRRAFQNRPQRLMAAMYTCSIQVSGEVLGKMYGVLGRRHGRILDGDLAHEGSASFSVGAVLPVVESFDLANEIRKQTSGLASHQLVFSHWEVIDTDPFWVPSTEEELELYGDKGDSINRAQIYMNNVRRRKGLPVTEKVVEFAEKQRTLSRKV